MEVLKMGGAVPYYKKRMGRGNFLRGKRDGIKRI